MKRGLVLAGGGSKGAYQAGCIKALKELGYDFDLVTELRLELSMAY